MSHNGDHYIVKSLDNQIRFLFWEMDEFAVLVIPFMLGILMGSFPIMISGFFLRIIHKKFKRKFPRGCLKQYIYWHFPTQRLGKMIQKCPPSHIRELLL